MKFDLATSLHCHMLMGKLIFRISSDLDGILMTPCYKWYVKAFIYNS